MKTVLMMRKFIPTLVWLICVSAFESSGLADDKDATEILQRAIKATGGERSVGTLKSPMLWMERGTFYGMGDGQPFVAQYAAKWPDWFRQEIENAFSITVRGEQAWVTSSAGIRNLSGVQLEEQLKQVRIGWVARLFPLTDENYTLSSIDGIDVSGRQTVGILASCGDDRDVKLYFDKQTFLIAKIETMVISPQHGPDPVLSETFYTDHKSFAGVMMPSKVKQIYDKKLFVEAETVDYKMAATLDPQQFEPPQ